MYLSSSFFTAKSVKLYYLSNTYVCAFIANLLSPTLTNMINIEGIFNSITKLLQSHSSGQGCGFNSCCRVGSLQYIHVKRFAECSAESNHLKSTSNYM